jgi:hypothetical protein
LRGGGALLRARLSNASLGELQIKILIQTEAHQLIKRGILEHLPPGGSRGFGRTCAVAESDRARG